MKESNLQAPAKALPSGRSLYAANCAGCHKEDLSSSPPEFPSLVGISKKYSESEVRALIRGGVGPMPGFPALGSEGTQAIARYLITGQDTQTKSGPQAPSPIDLKYTIDGYNRFLDPEGYPAVAPPWGRLSAIDLNRGQIT